MHNFTCTYPIIWVRSWASYCNPSWHCSCSYPVGGKPYSTLSPRSGSTHLSCFLPLLYHLLKIMLPILILATDYITFPSPFSALHPWVKEEGQTLLLSIPGLKLASHSPGPFPYSTPEKKKKKVYKGENSSSLLPMKQEKIFLTAQPRDAFCVSLPW